MQCPQCSGDVYDNTVKNAERIAGGQKPMPQFKCKDQACGWVKWPPKEKKEGGGKPTREPFVPQTVHQIAMAYQMSVAIARKAWAADKLPPQELRSAADTVFIGMQKGGTVGTFAAEKPKPADEE
jgi:hypothetical protein